MASNRILIFGETAELLPQVTSLLPESVSAACLTTSSDLLSALDERPVGSVVLMLSADAPSLDLPSLRPYLQTSPIILVALDGFLTASVLNELVDLPLQGVLPYPFQAVEFEALLDRSLAKSLPFSRSEDIADTLAETKLGAILKNAAEVVIVTDAANRLWLWSETAASLFDLDSEARGQLAHERIACSEIRELFDTATQQGSMVHTEVELRDGQVYNAQLSTVPNVGHVVVMQEITHLKELDRLKSEFVSTVSHDLRTPLTTIQGYIELLDRVGSLNEQQTDFINRALRSLNHITDLISDLLDIGRIEAGYDLEMRALRMDELVRTTAEAATVQARSQGIHLFIDVPASPLRTWGNARRLRQVLENLISNALKYNRPNGWVNVEARRDEGHIVVSVSDSGIGISAEDQARIFERFYRVQSPETEDVYGTGLGLAIVKSVVEKHKGRVWVESTPGEGSTFAFLLPLHEAPAGEAPDDAESMQRL
ncbi:MAG: sensor histidine kinase [Anaerolineae bacterium]